MDGDQEKGGSVQAQQHLKLVTTEPPGTSAGGIASGLELLFLQHHELIFRTACRVTGSPADAEDVLQTVFLRLLKSGDRRDYSPSPASYLHRAAVNASLDLLRTQKRSRAVPIEAVVVDGIEDRGVSPEREQQERELRTEIRKSISRLGPKAAEIVALKFFEGYGNREIADIVGTSHLVVAVLLHRARRRLRTEIAGYLEAKDETQS